jgi:hypothetical protein
MRYTVVWSTAAIGWLADLWRKATDQQAVADASDRLDLALRDDPERKGSPSGKFFVREEDPLAVLYRVDPGDCKVEIVAVKRI